MPASKCLVLCSAHNCYSTQHTSSLHKFPKDPVRAKEWATRCGRKDFYDIIKIYGAIPGNYRLCARHFTSNQFLDPKAKRKTLIHNAFPTIFELKSESIDKDVLSCNASVLKNEGSHLNCHQNGVHIVSNQDVSQFTKVINVQAVGDGAASAIVEGIFGDSLMVDDVPVEEIKCCVMDSEESVHPFTDSVSREQYSHQRVNSHQGFINNRPNLARRSKLYACLASRGLQLDSIRKENDTTKLSYALKEDASSAIPSRPKRKVGVVPLLEPWDLTREFCRKHCINYDSAIRCREQMDEWQHKPEQQPQHYTVEDSYSARADLLDVTEEGVDGDDSQDYRPGSTSQSRGRGKRGRGRGRGRRGRPPLSRSRGKGAHLRRTYHSSDSDEDTDSGLQHGRDPRSSRPSRGRGSYVNRRGRPPMMTPAPSRPFSNNLRRPPCASLPLSRRCCYSGCRLPGKVDTTSGSLLFPFPKDPGRCFTWVQNCNDENLIKKLKILGSDFLHVHYQICSRHFEPETFLVPDESLVWNAVPTIFSDRTSLLPYPSAIYLSPKAQPVCVAIKCHYSSPTAPHREDQVYFPFPKDPIRCALWVSNCGEPTLVEHFNKYGSSYVAQNMHLCRLHFAPRCFQEANCNNSLKEDALPTVFVREGSAATSPQTSFEDPLADAYSSDSDFDVLASDELQLAEQRVALSNKLLFLQEELDSLRSDGARQRAKLRYLRKHLAQSVQKRRQDYTVDDAFQYCKRRLTPAAYQFFKVQLFTIIKPRWNEKSLEVPIAAIRSGKKVFSSLSSLYRFPCTATIRRFRTVTGNIGFSNKMNSEVVIEFRKDSLARPRFAKRTHQTTKPLHKNNKPDTRKNKTVAQILEEFLGKRTADTTPSTVCNDMCGQPYLLSSTGTDGDDMVNSNTIGSVDNIVNDGIAVTDNLVNTDALVNSDNMVTTDNLVGTVSIATSDMVSRTLVVAGQIANDPPHHAIPTTSASILSKPLYQSVGLMAAPAHSGYIVNTDSITYIYDDL